MKDYSIQLSDAISYFWKTRNRQGKNQGEISGAKDQGNRSLVTGGAQLDGFIQLLQEFLSDCGLEETSIHIKDTTLPGFFRPTKEWDLVVLHKDILIASIEFKSHIGPSFGNNFNNRIEEALGSATDIWTAFREGAFKLEFRPWLGYFMLLEDHEKSRKPVKNREDHFNVFSEFSNASYIRRYEIFCEKIIREKLYDASCFILSKEEDGIKGNYTEPLNSLSLKSFLISLSGKIHSFKELYRQ